MNTIFIKKLKKAISTKNPVESVQELINEYEELKRLAEWRDKIILSGKTYKKNKKELDRVAELLKINGYHDSIINEDDAEVRDFFKKTDNK